jgi:hypothetical protein
MLGSRVAESVAACDTAVPLRPHSNAVDKMATAEGATRIDDNLMTMSFQIQDGQAVRWAWYHIFNQPKFRIWSLRAPALLVLALVRAVRQLFAPGIAHALAVQRRLRLLAFLGSAGLGA